MNRKLYLIILIILLLAAAYFFFSQKTTTISNEFSDFAIEDTSSIDRIFISDYNGISADLSRQEDNTWQINGKYKARPDGIELLLKTFKTIKVKEMIPQSGIDNVIKTMATRAIKVEIYTGGKNPEKVYYVGNSTQNHFGTYMLLELNGVKSSAPYIMHIPGFHGFLTARFFADENTWRERSIFNYQADDIASLSINYSDKPLNSFKLIRHDEGFKVIDESTKEEIKPIKEGAINEFLSRFKSIHFEYIPEASAFVNIDSVTSTKPLHVIEIQSVDGKKTSLKTYIKPVKESMIINEETGETYTYDLDRLYAWLNDTDFVVMQWPTLDQILAYKDDFRMTEIVDN